MAGAAVMSQGATTKELEGARGLAVALAIACCVAWEGLSRSGLLYRDVVPSLFSVGRALATVLATPSFFGHLAVTAGEIGTALAVGGGLATLVGIVLGSNPFLSAAFERFLHYLGPTPKIIFFPVMVMWFGVGPASKVAMGAISAFFPIVLSVAAGMRGIDPVFIRVGRSFKLSRWQTATKIYLPAMRAPILNGFRLGFGVAMIGALLAETKLSNAGIGHLVMQSYSVFDMPTMYALLIVLFVLAIAANELLARVAGGKRS